MYKDPLLTHVAFICLCLLKLANVKVMEGCLLSSPTSTLRVENLGEG